MSDDLKRAAGARAVADIESGMLVGLGTGSTAAHAIRCLGDRIRIEGLTVRAIPTSVASERLAREVGIELCDFEPGVRIDLTIDGADEVDASLRLIKGGGGALLREKVVAHRSRSVTIVIDPSKLVERLGVVFPLPVEVVPFAIRPVMDELAALGGSPIERRSDDDGPYQTDNGNRILDVDFDDGIADPAALEARLARIPGVVESGLFIDLADRLIIGRDGAPEVRETAHTTVDAMRRP